MEMTLTTLLPQRFNTTIAAIMLVTAAAWSVQAAAQTSFPATLAGHAVLPAMSLIPAPKDAPADLQVSGKFTTASGLRKSAALKACPLVARPACFCPSRASPHKAIQASNAWPTAATGC